MSINRSNNRIYITLNGLIIVSISLFISSGCAIYHHYGSHKGQVIDAETKEPLEGAAVLALYDIVGYCVGGSFTDHLDAQETVTDENGEFKIPALNKFTFRPLRHFESDPSFYIFKPGYGCFPYYRDFPGIRVIPKPKYGWTLSHEYTVVELPRLKTWEERLKSCRSCDKLIDLPENKYKIYRLLINQEYKNLGR